MIFQHHRFQIWNANQHPYRHSLSEFLYNNNSLPGVTNVVSALDYLTAVLYPQSEAAVANPAALPTVGNTINDMRVVTDNGDGKAASYRWEQREGDVAAKWYKIYDLDWGTDSILQGFLLKTQDIYVKQRGYDDLDDTGVPVAGSLAGQSVYGGASANTNLSLFANSGDGVGANTGFVQFGDEVRPITDSTFSLGTTDERWLKVWSDAVQAGTLLLAAGSITDSSGAISFDDENLTTTGSVTAGTLILAGGSITDTSGSISFGDENLTTTGNLAGNKLTATGAASSLASGTTIGDLTFTDGNVASVSAAIDFNALNLTTTGTGTFSQVTGGNVRLSANEIRAMNVNGSIDFYANGTGEFNFNNPTNIVSSTFDVNGGNATFTDSVVSVLGTGARLDVDNVRIDGNTVSTTDVNGDLLFAPNGTGLVSVSGGIFPATDSALDVGKTGSVWNKLWIDGSIGGATEILISELMTLRNIVFRDAARTTPAQAGDALFYDGVSGTYLASVPDSEVAHSGLSGLATGDSGHTQFAMLAGRAGGQVVQGGTAASESLTLESTAHATKGDVFTKDDFLPTTTASYSGGWSGTDLGGASNYYRHLYTKGEHFGLRLENVGANPSSSVQNVGRLVYNTADGDPYIDTGTVFKRLGSKRYETDTAWNGTETSKVVGSITGVDATKAVWQLKDNTNDYETLFVPLKATATNEVTISVGYPLPAGSYRLIGLE